MQVKKIQADRDLLFQENEDQAREYNIPTNTYTHMCVCVYVYICTHDIGINLGHEPELQNGWTRLQEKVSLQMKVYIAVYKGIRNSKVSL